MSSNLIQTLIKDLGTVVNNLDTALSSHMVHATTWLVEVFSLMHSKKTQIINNNNGNQWLCLYNYNYIKSKIEITSKVK